MNAWVSDLVADEPLTGENEPGTTTGGRRTTRDGQVGVVTLCVARESRECARVVVSEQVARAHVRLVPRREVQSLQRRQHSIAHEGRDVQGERWCRGRICRCTAGT